MGRFIITVLVFLLLNTYALSVVFPVSIEAQNIQRKPPDKIIAEGNVVVEYKDKILKAERIEYHQKEGRIYLYGNVYIKDSEREIRASRGWVSEDGKNGELFDVQGVIKGIYHIKADRIQIKDNVYIFYNTTFSTCPFDQYDWYIKAKKTVFIKDDRVIFKNISFKFCDIPVFYSPYFTYPASNRKTGLLFPEIGTDSYNDFKYLQPFFLVISRHSDMTITFDYRNQQGKGIGVEYRNRLSEENSVKTNFMVFSENSGGDWWNGRETSPLRNRWRVYGEGKFYLDEFDLFFKYDIPSDPYFFEDIYNSAVNLKYKSYTKSQLMAVMDKRYFSLEVDFDYLYDLSTPNNEYTLQRLPEVRFYLKKVRPFESIPFYLDFLSVDTYFYREKGTSGIRFDNTLNAQLYSFFGGFSNLFTVSPRATFYLLTNREDTEDKSPSRNLLSVENKLRYPFTKGYDDFIHSVIPQVKLSYVSKVNQDDLPYFDKEDRIPSAKDLDLSLFNILSFEDDRFLSWEVSAGYTKNGYYSIGNNTVKGFFKPLKNRLYASIGKVSAENTLYYDFRYNQIVRSITGLSFPIFNWLSYSLNHSYDKDLSSDISTNQISQNINLRYKNLSASYSWITNLKLGYVQRKNLKLNLDRKCWRLRLSYLEDFNKSTGKTFRTLLIYINILRTDIKLPFVSRDL
ncbi:MAG: LPS-assembly protein LptD [Aquificae bacterium]|nr:LPS-assembly protein LptD [Aquificota bacterium]